MIHNPILKGFHPDPSIARVGASQGVSAFVKYGGVTWCEVLEDHYRKKYGESITDQLPLLFEDGEEYEMVRENYWQLISEILKDNFYAPIHKWCQDNRKLYTAHLKKAFP